MLTASQGSGEMVYVWHATVAEALLDGAGNLSVSTGDATAYTATYTFAQSGNYRLFVIGKGGNGGGGGYGSFYENTGTSAFYKACGGSGGSGAYGACAVYEVQVAAGSTLTITYSATSTLVAINGHDITAAAGGDGGSGGNGQTIPSRIGGSAGGAGVAGSASGSNVSGGNFAGVPGIAGEIGGIQTNYSSSALAGPAGAATAAAVVGYMYGDGVAGGVSTTGTDRDGNDGAYLRTGALTKLGNPGSGGGGGAASATSANRVGGAGGLGQPGGLVIERRTYA